MTVTVCTVFSFFFGGGGGELLPPILKLMLAGYLAWQFIRRDGI